MIFLSHHKCASSLLAAYLIDVCQLNGMSLFASHLGSGQADPRYDVSHLSNAVYASVASAIDRPAVHVIRNPLNIVQSAYYSHLATHSVDGWPQLLRQRISLQAMSRDEGMRLTLEFCEQTEFYHATPGPLAQLAGWDFGDPRINTVRMEDFGDDPGAPIRAALGPIAGRMGWPDGARFTFRQFAEGRAAGQVDSASHYRSGDPDAWRYELPADVTASVRARYWPLLARFYPAALLD